MPLHFSKKNNPRVIIIQKLYSKYYNNEVELNFPKHRFKKFIKDVVNGTIERDDVIHEEITCLLYTSPSPRDRTRSRMPSSA